MPQNPNMAYPDNPEVASSYSFQIYGCRLRTLNLRLANQVFYHYGKTYLRKTLNC
jgi:hypothetical protein